MMNWTKLLKQKLHKDKKKKKMTWTENLYPEALAPIQPYRPLELVTGINQYNLRPLSSRDTSSISGFIFHEGICGRGNTVNKSSAGWWETRPQQCPEPSSTDF